MGIAKEEMGYVIGELNRMKMSHPRAFHNPPKYLLFKIMQLGNPRLGNNRKIGEFRIWLDSGEVEIVQDWRHS